MASHLRVLALALAGKSRVLPYAAATLAYTPRSPRTISLLPHFSTAPEGEGGHNYDGEEKGRVAVDPEHGGQMAQISPRMMGCGKSGSKEEPIGTCSTDGRSEDAEDGAQLSPPPPPTTTSGGEKSRGKKLLAAEEAAGLKILLSGGGSPDADAKKTGKAAYGLAVESSTTMGAAGVDVDVASGRRSPAEMGCDAAAGVDKDAEHLGDVPGVFKHHGDVSVRVDKDAGDAKHDGDVPGVSKHNGDMTACEDEDAGDVKHHGDVSVHGHKDAGDAKHDGDVPAAAAGGAIHHGKSRSSYDQCAAAEAGAIGDDDIAAYFRSLEKMVEREFHDTRVSFESSFQKHSKKMFQLREEMFEELWKQSQSMKHLRYQSWFLFFGVFCQLLGFAAIGFFYGISYAADYIEERIYALSSDERVAKLAKETLDGALSHVIEKMRNNLDMKEIFWNWWNSGSSEAPAEDSSSWWWWVWPSRWWGSKEEEEEIEGTDGKK